ncbi:hypothetical protein F4779DRAFT_569409 [Xylariaceae sp. FL0662B]|nr:hypothetical protein F4779DRAFT_569409 [Xylariaceae sp. FL0662B]
MEVDSEQQQNQQPQGQPESQSAPELQAQSNPEPQAQSEPQAQPQAPSAPEPPPPAPPPQPQPQPQPQPHPQLQSEPQLQLQPQPQPQPQSQPQPQPQQQPEPVSAPAPIQAPAPSPVPSQVPPPVSAPPAQPVNLSTHYPNGLPRSINGFDGNLNEARTAPARGTSRASMPAQSQSPSLASPSPAPAPVSISRPHLGTQPYQYQSRQPSADMTYKVPIVDVPRKTSRSSSSQNHIQGFPSPRRDSQAETSKFSDDLSRLTHAIQQSVPGAVRRAVRDHWEKCLLGSDFHHAFLLNACIHHSNGLIIRRAIKDFGAKMIADGKHEVIAHFKTSDIDELVNDILSKASDYFLDMAMEKRLRTIDARSLINALARAERLGYENGDVLDDHKEKVAAATPSMKQAQPTHIPQHQHKSNPPPSQAGRSPVILQCRLCWRKFHNTQPYEYHVQKQLCTKEPPNQDGFPFSCEHCGAGFVTKVGQQYHLANSVCGDHSTAPATPKAPVNSASPINISSGTNSPIQPPIGPSRFPATPSQYAAASVHLGSTPVETPGSIKEYDPYAHLNPSTLARLNEDLRQAELSYAPRFREAEAIADPNLRRVRVDNVQNSFSTKQSIIRKRYGVRLRMRRTRAEIEGERRRIGSLKHTGSFSQETPGAKRQRTDDGPTYSSSPAPQSGTEYKSNHLTVSDMNSAGLGGSSATAALSDPTVPASSLKQAPAQQSLSSYQRKGYRVSSHVPHSSQVSPTDTLTEGSTKPQSPQNAQQRSGSANAPVVLDDDDDDDDDSSESDDSDGDIPANLPPRKANGTAG